MLAKHDGSCKRVCLDSAFALIEAGERWLQGAWFAGFAGFAGCGSRARAHVLFYGASGVLDGHVPAAEVNHARAQSSVRCVQWSLLKILRAQPLHLRPREELEEDKKFL